MVCLSICLVTGPNNNTIIIALIIFLGKILKWQLILYGVAEEPVRLKQPKPVKPVDTKASHNAIIPPDDVSMISSAKCQICRIFVQLVKVYHP